MSDFDDSIREHYEQFSMNTSKLESIRELGRREQRMRILQRAYLATAAILVIALTLSLSFGGEEVPFRQEVTEHIAMVHNSKLNAEFECDTFKEIQVNMHKIDYSVIPSNDMITEKFNILGARYCTLGGQIAVHVLLEDKKTGAPGTLYIAKLNEELATLPEDTVMAENVRVQMWQDTGKIYAMAMTL